MFSVALHVSGSAGSSAATPARLPRNCGQLSAAPATMWTERISVVSRTLRTRGRTSADCSPRAPAPAGRERLLVDSLLPGGELSLDQCPCSARVRIAHFPVSPSSLEIAAPPDRPVVCIRRLTHPASAAALTVIAPSAARGVRDRGPQLLFPQNIAIGLTGEPVPLGIGNGATVNMNSHRLRDAATSLNASKSARSRR